MARLICEFKGARGRILKLYDTKLIIVTKKTIGSFLTGGFNNGEKTIFFTDIVGVQFKKSGLLVGYLQFETSSSHMNRVNNVFLENTFIFEAGRNGITNELIGAVYEFVVDRVEEIKYEKSIIEKVPNFEAMKKYGKDAFDWQASERQGEVIYFETHEDISVFKAEILNTATEDLELILEDQRNLYSDDEIKIIMDELQRRS